MKIPRTKFVIFQTAISISLSAASLVQAQELTPALDPPPVVTGEAPAGGAITIAKNGESKDSDKAPKAKPLATPSLSLASDITRACKEREKRMMALNDAMLKLREAGHEEDANRFEARLQAMIETKDPREDDALVANKAELLLMKRSVIDLTAEVANLRAVLEQNCHIIDQILMKAVPDISPAVIDEMKNQAKKQEIRKIP